MRPQHGKSGVQTWSNQCANSAYSICMQPISRTTVGLPSLLCNLHLARLFALMFGQDQQVQ